MRVIEGAINSPKGFKAGGTFIGIKRKRKDLALVYSEVPAAYAAMFTTNRVKAACVVRNTQVHAAGGPVQAVIVNSGKANACTGKQGAADNEQMAELTGQQLGITASSVVTASTGVIGVCLPMDVIEAGVQQLVPTIDDELLSGLNAAEAIMTTDTAIKTIAVAAVIGGVEVTIAGMAKGSGMIHPNMATMLSFVTTDAAVDQELLRQALREIGSDTYNMISVDGDTSTNDMVMVLANGQAGNPKISEQNEDYQTLYEALHYVHEHLAKEIVKDGEGASKFVEVNVNGACSAVDAKKLVKSILTSNLVKTAMFGEDANWGRILCAMGYSGAEFEPEQATLRFEAGGGSMVLLEQGMPVDFDEDAAYKLLQNHDIRIVVSLRDGVATAVGWGCDLSYDYVKINGEYRS